MLRGRASHRYYQLILTVKNAKGFHQNSVKGTSPFEGYCFPSIINGNRYMTAHSRNMLPATIQNITNVSLQHFSSETKAARTENSAAPKVAMDDPKITIKESVDSKKVTMKDKLKKAVKEYGSIVIVFHVSISLFSLGTCYFLVSSGLDVVYVLQAIGLQEWAAKSQLAANAGTFAVAYAIHKAFAPVRITITLGSVPFIVRYLRRIGFLK